VLPVIVLSDLFFASVAGLLTVVLYFLAFVLYAFTLHAEDAEYAGNNSGTYIGEHWSWKKILFFLLLMSKSLFYLKLAYLY
jgi:hypothetical protein